MTQPSIIVDNGCCKAGFAGDDTPQAVFPIVGHPKQLSAMSGVEVRSTYIGVEAQQQRSILTIGNPIESGIVVDWNEMEQLWNYTMESALRADPSGHPILLTEGPQSPKSQRENMMSLAFETFGHPACYISPQAVLALYASGHTTGTVLDSGDSVTHVVPVVEGFAVSEGIVRADVGGRDLDVYLSSLLRDNGHNFARTSKWETLREIKEKLCYVALDVHQERDRPADLIERDFVLPDNNVITIGQQRFYTPEALLWPSIAEMEQDGLAELTSKSIMKCKADIRKDLYSNIILCGGNTMFDRLSERMQKDVSALAPSETVKVIAPPKRQYSAWIGGSMLASLSTFEKMSISLQEYEESGPSVLDRIGSGFKV